MLNLYCRISLPKLIDIVKGRNPEWFVPARTGPETQDNAVTYKWLLFRIGQWQFIIHKMVAAPKEAYHSHQSERSFRLVLAGGYVEQVLGEPDKTWRPGMLGCMRFDYQHRIVSFLNGKWSYSLFIRGSTHRDVAETYDDGHREILCADDTYYEDESLYWKERHLPPHAMDDTQ